LQIIDGATAYTGGLNIGDEYLGKVASIGDWIDLFAVLRGPVVGDLQEGFLDDWFFATAKSFDVAEYFARGSAESGLPLAIVRSGPDNLYYSFQKAFINLCNHAQTTLDLFTPYFAPDHSLILALQLAVARGVKVRVMIPTKNEHQYMIDIGRAYYEALLETGVEVHEYPHAVIHSKVYIADGDTVLVGSPNLDIRSIRLNFELAILLKDRESVRPLVEEYGSLWEAAEQVDLEAFVRRPFKQRLREGAIRLLAPIL
jgi:cardiolipin synthase